MADYIIDRSGLSLDQTMQKVDTMESGAQVNQTDAEIKTQYENNADTNVFTDAEKSTLINIEADAFKKTTDNMDDILDGVTYVKSENNFSDADKVKLDIVLNNGSGDLFLANDGTYKDVNDYNIYKTNWINISGYEGNLIGDSIGTQLTHGLGKNVVDLDVMVFYSITGSDSDSIEITSSNAWNFGWSAQTFDTTKLSIQTGADGMYYLGSDGKSEKITNGFYKIVIREV